MRQYCRYCSRALDYNGEATDFLCMANASCGNSGAGKFYKAAKAKRPNKCPYFEFNPIDVFCIERTYHPKPVKANKQLSLSDVFEE